MTKKEGEKEKYKKKEKEEKEKKKKRKKKKEKKKNKKKRKKKTKEISLAHLCIHAAVVEPWLTSLGYQSIYEIYASAKA